MQEEKVKSISIHHAMGKFCRGQTDNIFLFFPENRIWYFMQIVSSGMKCQILAVFKEK